MGRPLPKALLVLLCAALPAAAEDGPGRDGPGPRPRSVSEQACEPGAEGLLVDLRGAPDGAEEGLGETLEGPEGEEGAPRRRFLHVKPPSRRGDGAECRRRFAAFAAGCPDCAAAPAPPGAVTLETANRLFADSNRGLGGLVQSLGALSKAGDISGLSSRVAGLFDGALTAGGGGPDGEGSSAMSLLVAPAASEPQGVYAGGAAGEVRPFGGFTGDSRFRLGDGGGPQLGFRSGAVPSLSAGAEQPQGWFSGALGSLRNNLPDWTGAPLTEAGIRVRESAVGDYGNRLYGAITRAVGADGQLMPVLPPEGVSPGLRVRNGQRSWGTASMVNMLRMTGADLNSRGQSLLVHDISKPEGGSFWRPHRSHQRGVDVDLPIPGPASGQENALLLARIARASRESGAGLQYIFSHRPHITAYRAHLARLAREGHIAPEDAQAAAAALNHEDGHDGHFHVRTLR
jgi:hypothetical protein